MDRFPVGTAVAVEIVYVDYNGDPVTPTAVTYTVTDENGNVITGPTAIAGPYTTQANITITGNFNTPAGARNIELEMTTAIGTSYVNYSYQVRDDNARLVLLTNTFQSLLQAKLTANDVINIPAWQSASDDVLIGAMAEAYYRLTRFGYLIRWPEYVDTQNIYLQDMHARITPQMWPVMTQLLFSAYPIQFQAALKKAQIVEANAVISPDPIGDKRRAGLLAESVGESKFMFRSGVRPLDMGISVETLKLLKTYLDYRFTLTRAP
jgi:hypothetical protein